MKKIGYEIKEFFVEFKILLRSVPALMVTLFVVSVVGMNLLANKSIDTHLNWLALDMGIILSWLSFLTMDIITKRFGPKAGIMISVLALLVNLLFALIFFIAAIIPGVWGESYVEGSEKVINTALNNTFRGTWYILLGSSIAFIVSAVVNCLLNFAIGKAFKKKPNSFVAFALRSYVSTAIGQFVDNLLFALIVSKVFFGWTLLQCVTCALTGMVVELLCEVIFSPIGYASLRRMEKDNVGKDYLDYIAMKKEAKINESTH
ncbi:MAG: VUT family protein [Bacilli bacterium]|nr:VUT family protein [Bacilli bacterium]